MGILSLPMKSLSDRLAATPSAETASPAEAVTRHQRRRILDAVTELVARRGYQATTLELIAKTAGVAFVTFYEHFDDKQQAVVAAFDEAVADAGARLDEAVDPGASWPEQIEAGLREVVALALENPDRARLCLIEIQAAGPEALARYEAVLESVSPKLREGRALAVDPDRLPRSLEESTAGGLAWLLHQQLVTGREDELAAMLPDMLAIVLSPYLGEAEARRAAGAG